MQKVLFIAYQFPPQSGPGVHRSINFVKHLPEFGYEPIVITKDFESTNANSDKELLALFTKNTKIYRLKGLNIEKVVSFLMKLKIYRFFWFTLYPLLWEFSTIWFLSVTKKTINIIKSENINTIYTTSGPFSSLLLGRSLQKKLGVKWVADLRDPFTDAYAWAFPSKTHWYMMRKWEKNILSKPDQLIVNTEAVKELYIKRGFKNAKNIKVITNGF